jgi:hypothetical protein
MTANDSDALEPLEAVWEKALEELAVQVAKPAKLWEDIDNDIANRIQKMEALLDKIEEKLTEEDISEAARLTIRQYVAVARNWFASIRNTEIKREKQRQKPPNHTSHTGWNSLSCSAFTSWCASVVSSFKRVLPVRYKRTLPSSTCSIPLLSKALVDESDGRVPEALQAMPVATAMVARTQPGQVLRHRQSVLKQAVLE